MYSDLVPMIDLDGPQLRVLEEAIESKDPVSFRFGLWSGERALNNPGAVPLKIERLRPMDEAEYSVVAVVAKATAPFRYGERLSFTYDPISQTTTKRFRLN